MWKARGLGNWGTNLSGSRLLKRDRAGATTRQPPDGRDAKMNTAYFQVSKWAAPEFTP
jgi:hypothetical protein